MNRQTYLIFGALMLLQYFAVFAQTESADEAQIRQTLAHYIEGRREGDLERLKKAFHPSAALKFVDTQTGALAEWSLEEYLARLKPGKKQECSEVITDIHIFNNAAQASILLSYAKLRIHDYISLLKVEGEWLIVDKTFAKKPIEKAAIEGGFGSPGGKAFNSFGFDPAEARCEICSKQEYRDKSADCPHD